MSIEFSSSLLSNHWYFSFSVSVHFEIRCLQNIVFLFYSRFDNSHCIYFCYFAISSYSNNSSFSSVQKDSYKISSLSLNFNCAILALTITADLELSLGFILLLS